MTGDVEHGKISTTWSICSEFEAINLKENEMAKAKTPAKGKKVETDEEEGVRIRPDLEKYQPGTSASGKRTQNCGDAVAIVCDGFTVEELCDVAENGGYDGEDLAKKYGHLNYGQQVMCVRNVIRGLVNAEEAEDEGNGEIQLNKWARTQRKAAETRNKAVAKDKEAKAKVKADNAKAKAKAEKAKKKAA